MYIVNKFQLEKYLGCKIETRDCIINIINSFIRNEHIEGYVINAYYCNKSLTYYDYYFLDQEHIWVVSDCPINDKRIFDFYFEKAYRYLKNVSRCLEVGDFKKDCIILARTFINYFIKVGCDCEENIDILNYKYFPKVKIDCTDLQFNFLKIDEPIGFYQIVPDFQWLKYVVNCGVKFVQLRIKNQDMEYVEKEIKKSVDFALKNDVALFINDYWKLAIKYGAYGIHLGQSDLKYADCIEILNSKIHLGISTHCYHELATSCNYNPSYIALGPIFKTYTKDMSFSEQGIDLLKQWVKLANNKIVAIGGINLSNIDRILDLHIDGFSLISSVINSSNPREALETFIQKSRSLLRKN